MPRCIRCFAEFEIDPAKEAERRRRLARNARPYFEPRRCLACLLANKLERLGPGHAIKTCRLCGAPDVVRATIDPRDALCGDCYFQRRDSAGSAGTTREVEPNTL